MGVTTVKAVIPIVTHRILRRIKVRENTEMVAIIVVITHVIIPMVTSSVVLTILDAVTILLVKTIITITFTVLHYHSNPHHYYCGQPVVRIQPTNISFFWPENGNQYMVRDWKFPW